MKVLIVGGVAGGASTAARLRRLDETTQIIMFERGPEISYANCGIPYHIGNTIKEREALVVVSPEKFRKEFKVDVRVRSEVMSIDRASKKITVFDQVNNNTYEETYDYLVLSPGASPVRPPLAGINDSRIFTIRNLTDMDAMRTFIEQKQPKKAVVIGAGFIGLEMAENLHQRGMQVSVVELGDQVMSVIDYEMATLVHQELQRQNVELYLKDAVEHFEPKQNIDVHLKSGRTINADLVVLSIGVRPEIKLAKESGLTIGALGGIQVDENLHASDPAIFALGDVVETIDSVSHTAALVPLANAANKQGRVVADNIMGGNKLYSGTPATAIAKVFDVAVATTGNSEKLLKRKGLAYSKVYLLPSSHAGYYPGAFPLSIKVLYAADSGRLLGAQIVGAEGVDKRIDVLAALIQLQHTIYDLAALELAYAPPFSSAKDPVNLAGMIAINQQEGKAPVIYWDEVKEYQSRGALFVDVRSPLEFQLGHIAGAINIPLARLRDQVNDIPRDRQVVLYCNQGKTGYFALRILLNLGYTNVVNVSGGYKLYAVIDRPQENVGVFTQSYIDKREEIHTAAPGQGGVICLDACGLQCPGPIMKLAQKMHDLKNGDILEIAVTDPGFKNDIGIWCQQTNNRLLDVSIVDKKIIAQVQKGAALVNTQPVTALPHDKTIIVFSSDLDKALASFVIANGALAMDRKVTMFFTFWGLNVLRKPKKVSVAKGFLDTMFGIMMPRGSKQLHLSQMNMFGMGPQLIRYVMKQKNIDSLEAMIAAAIKAGVRIVACQMSMDMMGIKAEELIDGVEIGGVASYLGAAEFADTNLFIS